MDSQNELPFSDQWQQRLEQPMELQSCGEISYRKRDNHGQPKHRPLKQPTYNTIS
jgi:hypothetical protein